MTRPFSSSILLPLLVVVVVLLTTTNAQTTSAPSTAPTTTSAAPTIPVDCASQTTTASCSACVSSGCAWGIGSCFDSCDELTELNCYSLATSSSASSSTSTASSICQQQQQEAQDTANCGIQTDCESCTSTRLTSVNALATNFEEGTPTECSWYESQQKCSDKACDTSGDCASPYCPASPEGECYFGATNCLECLELELTGTSSSTTTTPKKCAWTGGNCELTCLENDQDAVCYSDTESDFKDQTPMEICNVSDAVDADAALCDAQNTDCEACTTTTKSDGTSTCEYYFDWKTQSGWCGLGSSDDKDCDGNGTGNNGNVCGVTECSMVPENPSDLVCSGLDIMSTSDVRQGSSSGTTTTTTTCTDCLEAGCGWTSHKVCLSSCDFLADAGCWDVPDDITSTVASVCDTATDLISDADVCGAITECDICTSQLKSDRRRTCEWYAPRDDADSDAEGYCGTGDGCDPNNGVCGSILCPADSGGSSTDSSNDSSSSSTARGCGGPTKNTCFNCLGGTNEDECVWVDNICQQTCAASPDEVCYSVVTQPGSTVSAICNTAATESPPDGSGAVTVTAVGRSMMMMMSLVVVLATAACF